MRRKYYKYNTLNTILFTLVLQKKYYVYNTNNINIILLVIIENTLL